MSRLCLVAVSLVIQSLLLQAAAPADPPEARFTASVTVGAPPLAVTFTDASTGSPTAWSWDFGGGETSPTQSPTHTYTTPGFYTVTLTASNQEGLDTEVKLEYIVAATGRIVSVSTSADLNSAVWNAQDGDTIVVSDGTYEYASTPFLRLEAKSDVTIRGSSGDPAGVILRGQAWDSPENNDDILWIWGCSNVRVAYLTFEDAHSYGIKLENTLQAGRGLQNINICHCIFRNIGVRMIKGTWGSGQKVDGGSIRRCHFENTLVPPSNWYCSGNYISAIDCMLLKDWVISDNTFSNIKGNCGGGRGAIFVWQESDNVVSERNVFIGCDRSICYGNPSGSNGQYHTNGGAIRNNFIVAGANTAVEICWSSDLNLHHNTIWSSDPANGDGIHHHYNTLHNIHIANNIVRGRVWGDSGGVTSESNITTGIEESWFVDLPGADLHLASATAPPVDGANPLPDCPTDFDRETRPAGSGEVDIGADELCFRFTDVPPTFWAYDAIEACALAEIVRGYLDGLYHPELPVTREQMAVYISRPLAGGDSGVPPGPSVPTFSDVPSDHWAYDYVEYAVAANVVGGYADGSYRPRVTVNRGQMAVFIARALVTSAGNAGIPDPGPPATFPDVPSDMWCYKHVEYLYSSGLVYGYMDGSYRPTTPVTRDQMAVYVERALLG